VNLPPKKSKRFLLGSVCTAILVLAVLVLKLGLLAQLGWAVLVIFVILVLFLTPFALFNVRS
jgi:hypothetical protein